MKTKIYFILATIFFSLNSISFCQIRNTQMTIGDKTVADYQKELSILNYEIEKIEIKKEAELNKIEKEKEEEKETKKTSKVKKEKDRGIIEEEIINDNYYYDEPSGKEDSVEKFSSNSDSKKEKERIEEKYEKLLEPYLTLKKTILNNMISKKEIVSIANNSNSQKAANLYYTVKMADNIGNYSSGNIGNIDQNSQIVMLKAKNKSTTCSITIKSAPFNGITLTPGQESKIPYPVNTGVYTLVYTEYRNGSNYTKERIINIPISEKGGEYINIFDK